MAAPLRVQCLILGAIASGFASQPVPWDTARSTVAGEFALVGYTLLAPDAEVVPAPPGVRQPVGGVGTSSLVLATTEPLNGAPSAGRSITGDAKGRSSTVRRNVVQLEAQPAAKPAKAPSTGGGRKAKSNEPPPLYPVPVLKPAPGSTGRRPLGW